MLACPQAADPDRPRQIAASTSFRRLAVLLLDEVARFLARYHLAPACSPQFDVIAEEAGKCPVDDRRATVSPEQSSRALIRHRVGGDVGLHEWWLAPGGHQRFGPRQDHLPADRHLDQQGPVASVASVDGAQPPPRLRSRASDDCTVPRGRARSAAVRTQGGHWKRAPVTRQHDARRRMCGAGRAAQGLRCRATNCSTTSGQSWLRPSKSR
jgi:hypothetical protein